MPKDRRPGRGLGSSTHEGGATSWICREEVHGAGAQPSPTPRPGRAGPQHTARRAPGPAPSRTGLAGGQASWPPRGAAVFELVLEGQVLGQAGPGRRGLQTKGTQEVWGLGSATSSTVTAQIWKVSRHTAVEASRASPGTQNRHHGGRPCRNPVPRECRNHPGGLLKIRVPRSRPTEIPTEEAGAQEPAFPQASLVALLQARPLGKPQKALRVQTVNHGRRGQRGQHRQHGQRGPGHPHLLVVEAETSPLSEAEETPAREAGRSWTPGSHVA